MSAPDWRTAAACRDEPTDLHFPVGDRGQIELAKDVCRRCPVRQQCLAFALKIGANDGIWGGLDERERANLTRRIARRAGTEQQRRHGGGRPKSDCGTYAAYRRHLDRGEPVDDACAEAHEADKARRRRAKWTTPERAA
jgi:WhiB family redox-sensing transcriptional regulator